MHAAIERILHRHILLRGGTATAAGELAWDVSFSLDPDDEASPALSFACRFTVEGGRVTTVHCDAPLDRYDADQAAAVAELHEELAGSLDRERIGFASFEALAVYLVKAGATEDDGSIEVPAGDESVFLS